MNLTTDTGKSKRGRKPKTKNNDDSNTETKFPKKRGRKPKNKVYSSQLDTNTVNSDNIILHLPIQKKFNDSKEKEFLTYNPDMNVPIPNETDGLSHCFNNVHFLDSKDLFQYNKNENVNLNVEYNDINHENKNTEVENTEVENTEVENTEVENTSADSNKVNGFTLKNDINNDHIEITINHSTNWYQNKNLEETSHQEMIDSIKKKREKEIEIDNLDQQTIRASYFLNHFKNGWPQSTSIYCWWCCHPFKGCPCAIPKEYKNNVFHTYGIFCSPECAAAHNFSEGVNIWEQYSLLNLLYKRLYNNKNLKIKLAPDKKLLNIFGGSLNIKEFRKLNLNYEKSFKVVEPPMISIVPIQEFNFIDNGYTSNEYSNDLKILKKNIINNTGLKLKRSKPIHNESYTLENFMNISSV